MIIKSVRVRNFRSIRDEVLPCEQLTVLVGPNGSGKSSFLRALDIFYTPSAKYIEEDFYARDTSQDILITVTFTQLTEEEKKLFQKYVEREELTVENELKWPLSRTSQKYYGMSLQNPEFDSFRSAQSARDRRSAYDALLASGKYPTLPGWTRQDDAVGALRDWEEANPAQCLRKRDEGQFFGFKEVGEAHLERHTRFLFVPAVRDASQDATEGRGAALSEIMDLVVRAALVNREDVRKLQEDTRHRYDQIMDPTKLVELQTLANNLTGTLKRYVPDASVDLTWLSTDGIEIPMPKADIKLVEDGYPSAVAYTGHGLQRAFILTMLEHLVLAKAPLEEIIHVAEIAPIEVPNLILGIEEPELYQHPNRQRHLSKVLLKLATGRIKGVAQRTQVIYSTHSPLFVDLERFEQLRIFRKQEGIDGKPRQTKILHTTLDEVARIIEIADDKPKGTYAGETLKSRLQALMTPWMNEGFFSQVAVLVEGEEDRAAIVGIATAMEHDFESLGISVIPCMGKNNIDRPTAVFRNLKIPIYAVWDSDYGNKEAKPEDNHRLLRLFGQPIEDWPEKVTAHFACFKQTLRETLCTEIGQEVFDHTVEVCCERLRLGKKQYATKNPIVIQEIVKAAWKKGKKTCTLEEIVSRIVALTERRDSIQWE